MHATNSKSLAFNDKHVVAPVLSPGSKPLFGIFRLSRRSHATLLSFYSLVIRGNSLSPLRQTAAARTNSLDLQYRLRALRYLSPETFFLAWVSRAVIGPAGLTGLFRDLWLVQRWLVEILGNSRTWVVVFLPHNYDAGDRRNLSMLSLSLSLYLSLSLISLSHC